jgi:hypothetical protein
MRRPLRPGPGKSPNVTTAPRPARGLAQYWYLLAPLIILFGWGAMETTLSWRTQEAVDRMIRVVVPGDAELKLEEPGTYTIFHEYHSLVDGRIYTVEGVSGLTINVLSRSAEGEGLPLSLNSAVGLSYDTKERAGRSLFSFEVGAPGTYHLIASYADRRSTPQTVLAVAHNYAQDRATTTFVAKVFAFGSLALALIAALTVLRNRRQATKATPQGPG